MPKQWKLEVQRYGLSQVAAYLAGEEIYTPHEIKRKPTLRIIDPRELAISDVALYTAKNKATYGVTIKEREDLRKKTLEWMITGTGGITMRVRDDGLAKLTKHFAGKVNNRVAKETMWIKDFVAEEHEEFLVIDKLQVLRTSEILYWLHIRPLQLRNVYSSGAILGQTSMLTQVMSGHIINGEG